MIHAIFVPRWPVFSFDKSDSSNKDMMLKLQTEGRVKWRKKKQQQKQMDRYVQRHRFKYEHTACREVQARMEDLEI